MSDNYVVFIPEDPRFVPSEAGIADARTVSATLFPKADAVEVALPKSIEFFHAGVNFELILCPQCGKELSSEWWGDAMEADHSDSGYRLGSLQTPCCGGRCTLNDLRYEWPQRFGMFALEVQNPNVGLIPVESLVALERALGTFLRVVYRHL